MDMFDKAQTEKLAQGLIRINEIIWGGVYARAFQSAYELGIFEALSEGSMTSDDLAARVKIHPVGCRRLLMALVKKGLVEKNSQGYKNTELGQLCTSRSPVNLGPVTNINRLYHMHEHLSDAVREYGPQWKRIYGESAHDSFDAMYKDPTRLRKFCEYMHAISDLQGRFIAESFDFTPYKCIMDVAGGTGGQVYPIIQKYPHMRAIITELKPVCELAEERIKASGLSDRFTVVDADLFKGPYPSGADVILLGHIMHDWGDESCKKILRHCAAALPSNGVLLLSESVLASDYSGATHTIVKDLNMLITNESGARERTESEYASLLKETGFELTKVIILPSTRDLLIARKIQ